MKAFQALSSEVMKKTDNKVQFKIYPGGVLGDEKDLLRKMKIGQIQGAALTASGLSSLFAEIDVYKSPSSFKIMKRSICFAKDGCLLQEGF